MAGLDLAIGAAERFRDVNLEALASVELLDGGMAAAAERAAEAATAVAVASGYLDDFRTAAAEADFAVTAMSGGLSALGGRMDVTGVSTATLSGRLNDLRDAAELDMTASLVLRDAISDLRTVLATAAVSASAMARSLTPLSTAAGVASTRMGALGRNTNGASAAASLLSGRLSRISDQADILTGSLAVLDAELDKKKAALGAVAFDAAALAVAVSALNTRTSAAAAGTAAAAAGTRIWGTGLRATSNAIHWIISGTAELLAVLVPATVAAGAWAAAWLQGSVNVYQHIMSVYTATEAMANAGAKTAGQMLGLGKALQTAQNQANPDVYQALGGAINVVRESAGGLAQAGLRVGQIFDSFMGKMVYDFSAAGGAGKTLNSILSGMIPDLVGVGQVFGNLGHFIASFASQMPGLAEVLLQVLDDVTRLASDVVDFAGQFRIGSWSVLTLVMALEETNRWGGLVVGLFGKMGIASGELATGMLNPVRAMGVLKNIVLALPMAFATLTSTIGSYVTRFSSAGSAINGAGVAMRDFGADATDTLTAITPLQGALIALAVAGLGFLIYKIVTAKSQVQELTDSMQKSVEKASDMTVYGKIAANLGQLSQAADTASASIGKYGLNLQAGTKAALAAGRSAAGQEASYNAAKDALATLNAGMTQQVQDAVNVTNGAQKIASTYGISIPQAMALAQAAGVNLSNKITTQGGAWNALGEKVRDAYRGFQAMGAASGTLGNDMLAVAIQTGEAGTQVSKLNQAWDSVMQSITGGTAALGSMVESLKNIGQVTQSTNGKLGEFGGQMSLTAGQSAKAMESFGATGSQVWQNFDSSLTGSAEQLTDWVRSAQSMGLKTASINEAVRAVTAQFLPFTAHSKAAVAQLDQLAQQGGAPVTDSFRKLKEWVDSGGHSMSDLTKIVDGTTIAMGNMASVASNLGDVMNAQVASAISAAALKASGFTTDANNLATALAHGSAAGHNAAYWARQEAAAYNHAGQEAATATGKVARYSSSLNHIPRNVNTTVTTWFTSHGTAYSGGSGGGHHIVNNATGTNYAAPGLSWVGEQGPELVHFAGGERVTPNWQARGGAGGGGGTLQGVNHIHVYLDGEEIWRNQQRYEMDYSTDNSGSRTGRWTP